MEKRKRRLYVIGYPNLYIDTRTDHCHYYWREVIDGFYYDRTTKVTAEFKEEKVNGRIMARATKNVQIASQIAEKLKHEILRGDKIRNHVNFSTLFEEVMKVQTTKAKRTYVIALDSVKNLLPFFGKIFLKTFDTDSSVLWSNYVTYKKSKSERKLLHDCKFLVFSLRIAYQKRWVSRIYSRKDFTVPDKPHRVGKYVTDEQIKLLVKEIKKEGDKRFLTQLYIALEMGLRRSEVLGLRVDEIDIERKEINLDLNRVKTRKARQIPIPITKHVWALLCPFYQKAKEIKGKYVFPHEINNGHGMYNLVQKGRTDENYDWDRCQVELPKFWDKIRAKLNLKIRFHDLRHTCVSNLIVAKIPLPTISQFVGADMKILNEVYAHHNDESKNLFRNALEGRYDD